MPKRMTTDETFHTYLVLKGLLEIHPERDGSYGLWLEDFYLAVNDYDLWEEGEPGVEYKYPWTNDVADDLAGFGIKRTNRTQVHYNGQCATTQGRSLLLDGDPVEGVTLT